MSFWPFATNASQSYNFVGSFLRILDVQNVVFVILNTQYLQV